MPSGEVTVASGKTPRKMRHPVDIALDAGMRPMLIKHGFRRKTKRYYVRETENSIQVVPIFAGNRRGYQGAAFGDCGNVLIKELVKLAEELGLGRLDPIIRSTDHECHMTCELEDYFRFFYARPYQREVKKKYPFIWQFMKYPAMEEKIPEILLFRKLYSQFEERISHPESVPLIENYGKARAEAFEKYILPWFDKCDDITFAVRWIRETGVEHDRTGNLLLAAAACLAGDIDLAKPQLERAVKQGQVGWQDYYDDQMRWRFEHLVLHRPKSKRFAKRFADFATRYFRWKASRAIALAERFGIQLD